MSLTILCDENLPRGIIEFIKSLGFEVLTPTQGSSDPEVAKKAKEAEAIILTFDSDFANILAYPPREYFGIVRIDIDPPFIKTIKVRLNKLFAEFKRPQDLQGKLIILSPGKFRVWEEE